MARESAISINFPELTPLLDPWRAQTVAVASRGVPPHVTLLWPWRPAPLMPLDLDEVAEALSGLQRFSLELPCLGRFPKILYLHAEPYDVLKDLIQRLAMHFPETPPYGGAFADPIPHLTIAEAATEAELDRMEAEIAAHLRPHLPIEVEVREIFVEEEGGDGIWSVRATIPLGG